MVQGDNPLEVTTESEVDDIDMSYDELTSFCQILLEKYDMIKKENWYLNVYNILKALCLC